MTEIARIRGQYRKKAMWRPFRVLLTVTGLSLLTGGLALISRYLFQLRASATAEVNEKLLTIETSHSIFGRTFKSAKSVTPLEKVHSVRVENRYRTLHLVIGFGFLTAGLLFGVHWLLDGLGAGYPYLFLLGAAIVLLGMSIDIIIFYLVPTGECRTSVAVRTAFWQFCLTGLKKVDATQFVAAVAGHLSGATDVSPDSRQNANESASE
jgi:hypothetical protein